MQTASHTHTQAVVSFDDEPLILVDENNRVLGHASKAACHDGQGILHRAFSVFLFDQQGRLLLQRRSEQKRLWPLVWSNTCCSHPRRGEATEAAAHRRVREELGLTAALRFTYSFVYHAPFLQKGAEHEHCAVFVGQLSGDVVVNDNEIAQTKFMYPDELDAALLQTPASFTPWLHLEWPRIRSDFWHEVGALQHSAQHSAE